MEGEQIAAVPKFTFNFGRNYELSIRGYAGRVTLTNSYRSGAYLNTNHAEFSYQDAYNITNLWFGLGTIDRKYEVSLA